MRQKAEHAAESRACERERDVTHFSFFSQLCLLFAHAGPTLDMHLILCRVEQGKAAETDSRRARKEVKQVKRGSPTLGSHVMCAVCSFAKRLLAFCLRLLALPALLAGL